ncbi:NAD(P)H-binding protein [Solwaraspora sp. WMMD1047]|uniref:NmrA family NAD(P)-binding protein n=1 Tax=Solwaraspora sp. WMMD1047 TaxID=3016102 RepID=UPI0024177720|nr:NAD(P)H-binding protein [Solwaraspora sp. WMMD1047]MDG4833662.1 NAD(P)H-binding protein [Solwaraspora sp. WMMD1047]
MITVTAATGHLGRLVVRSLLDRGVPAGEIVAAVRDPGKAADLAAAGVQVREADYDRPETLAPAFVGADRLLFISGSEVGRRVAQHANVVAAAVAAGVPFLAYTSILNADTTAMELAAEHRVTEKLIRDSGIPYVFLRNGWYIENYTDNLGPVFEHGVLLGAAGDGRLAGATRADYADAAAAVLLGDGPTGVAYELAGDTPFSLAELVAEVAAQSGRTLAYQDLPADAYAKTLVEAGLPAAVAQTLADCDLGIARGELVTDSGDLTALIGRPATSLTAAVGAALKTD